MVTREGEVPLTFVSTTNFLLVGGIDGGGQLVDPLDFAFPFDFAVHLQVADVAARPIVLIPLVMRVIHDLGVGEITIPGACAGDAALTNPVDQLRAKLGVVFECFARFLALIAFLESLKLQRIVLATGADVVGEQVVVSDLAERSRAVVR